MLVLKNINKKFNDSVVLKNLNMEVKGGLNFIVGPSGSGKSTLLKIISGMDKEYDGEVFYRGKELKDFNSKELDSYYYNSVGFIWQNFQLIEHLSVEDNIKVVLELENLSKEEMDKKVTTILRKLSIDKLSARSVSTLSGGQKQRVAIARALVKDPEIIIADEPTGALDKKTSNLIMETLRKIAKEKTVIVVTHDKSLVSEDSNCFLLKGGVISQISDSKTITEVSKKSSMVKPKLSLGRAAIQGARNFKGLFMKFTLTSLVLMLASYFLLLNVSGTVVNEQQNILNKLIEERGNTLRDIDLVTSMVGGSSTDDKDDKKGSVDVKQDVSKAFERLKNDDRVEFIAPLAIVDNMTVKMENKEYTVETSNNVPVLNEVVAGRIPKLEGREVAVTKMFLEKLKLKPEEALGKVISINGNAFDWSSGEPKEVKAKANDLTIVGVIDSKFSISSPKGGKYESELEDSFIYSLEVAKEIKKQTNSSTSNISFRIRVKEVKDIMPIVKELEKDGLTPIGMFEMVKDILKINNTTKEQSGSLTIIIAAIAIVVSLAVTIINGYLRKKEFAILKINGYSKGSIMNLNIMEYVLISIVSAVVFVVALPLINSMSKSMLDMTVSGSNTTILGLVIVLILGLVMGVISAVISSNIKTTNNLMTGDR
ncbi:ABC-type lipoprotein export system, ATPase component [Clostridium collagenovorans DSM 3089]|uniref:ABC-type lipoprotein export system, ATPase component n=1 Tax=Clostridium collagenovorans DSM 3089 TaxID=1121306 RepID=A0A1M5X735_9CLOT|nr:ATP-binding cassette domain-containing protein [Clostridium collagenovorans]SHH95647.1 ABC-type lipoprotein export system, ATPase component [Clostridium collagenovorans DSM 3089]